MGNQRRRKKLTPEEELEAFEAINRGHSGNIFDKIKIDIKSKTPNQKKLVNEIKAKEIVICSGLPGTGKTFLSCAYAGRHLLEHRIHLVVQSSSTRHAVCQRIGGV